jgi:quinol-cytochrome oxidoreductase complex cytochrome b subunit
MTTSIAKIGAAPAPPIVIIPVQQVPFTPLQILHVFVALFIFVIIVAIVVFLKARDTRRTSQYI